jgi:uncharacterized surface protein with fasciclin (FAS1) repeats
MLTFPRAAAAAMAIAATLAVAPARADDIVDVASKAGTFTTLVAAAKAAGLVDTLKGKGPFTVFAPTDDAFKKLPAGTVETLLKPENKAQLTSILTYHVLPGRYDAKRITGAAVRAKRFGIRSVQGSNVEVDLRQGVKVSGATVTRTDIAATNGVIHVIDTVMMPPKRTARRQH